MGTALVNKSITAEEDTIYVSFNYRLVYICVITYASSDFFFKLDFQVNDNFRRVSCNLTNLEFVSLAYGFLGGDEVEAAGVGNLGLRDRMFLSRSELFGMRLRCIGRTRGT